MRMTAKNREQMEATLRQTVDQMGAELTAKRDYAQRRTALAQAATVYQDAPQQGGKKAAQEALDKHLKK